MSEIIGLLYALLFLLVLVVGSAVIMLIGALLFRLVMKIIEKSERSENGT